MSKAAGIARASQLTFEGSSSNDHASYPALNLSPHWPFMTPSHANTALSPASRAHGHSCGLPTQLTVKGSAERQPAWAHNAESARNTFLSLSQTRGNTGQKKISEDFTNTPEVQAWQCWWQAQGAWVEPAQLWGSHRDGLSLLECLLAEATLIQSALKWKHPLEWRYWQYYNIFSHISEQIHLSCHWWSSFVFDERQQK